MVTEREWENEYRGTETAFIKPGSLNLKWLPGQPGNAKRIVTVTIIDGEMKSSPASISISGHELPMENGYICITKAVQRALGRIVNCLEEEHEKGKKSQIWNENKVDRGSPQENR